VWHGPPLTTHTVYNNKYNVYVKAQEDMTAYGHCASYYIDILKVYKYKYEQLRLITVFSE